MELAAGTSEIKSL